MSSEIEELAVGQVQWHCSEPEGGPDVGILLNLGGGNMLWLGEMTSREDVGPLGLAVYENGQKIKVLPMDYEGIREVLEDYVAPSLRALAQRGEGL